MGDVRDPHAHEVVAAHELAQRLVDQVEGPVAADQRHPHRRALEHDAEALGELGALALGGADVGQVLADADQVARAAGRAVDGAAHAQVAQLAVAAPDRDEAVEVAVVADRGVDLVAQAAAVLRHDLAEHALARRHEVLGVDAEDAVGLGRPDDVVGLEVAVEGADLAEPLRLGEPLLGAPALGDVLVDAVEAPDGAVGPERGAAADEHQAVAAVGVAHPHLELHRAAGLHRRDRRRGDPLAVVRMDEVQRVGALRRALRVEAEHAPQLGRPRDRLALGLPVPGADAGDLLRLAELGLAALAGR